MADTLPRLSVVIPLYKEEDNVERLVDELHAALETYPGEFELVLVDDGSTDRTRELLLESRSNRGDHIMVISHKRNLGQTQAFRPLAVTSSPLWMAIYKTIQPISQAWSKSLKPNT